MTHPCEYCGDNEGHTNSRYMLDDNGEGSWVCAACEEQFDALAHEFDDDLDQVYGD